MTDTLQSRLHALGHTLPEAPALASPYYQPAVQVGQLLYVSGQISQQNGHVVTGHLGDGLPLEEGRRAAQLCALGLLAQLDAAIGGDLRRVRRVVRVGVYVAATPQFTQHSEVGNGVSALLVEVFQAEGRHARTSIGVASLPAGAAVEADAVFELVP